jgi:DNA-binding NarL/FixJ family response regulator
VDGQPILRCGMLRIADGQSDLHVVGETGSINEALRMTALLRPDVVSISFHLVDGNGMDLARGLRDRYPDLGIVILTSHDEDDVLFRALETGVSAFVSKFAPPGEVLAAIRHAATAASSFSAAGLADALHRRSRGAERPLLSEREGEVLALLQEGRSVPEIAATLYISVSTTKTYVARIYDKLGASNRATALMAAVRLGLVRHVSLPA